MPTYEAQRALPPTEVTIKETWLAHRRREWQRNVSARRRSLSDDPSRPPPDLLDAEATAARVGRCLAAKEASGLSYDDLASELGLTNTYTAQLLLGQAQLKPATAEKLQKLLKLTAKDVKAMQGAPMRGFNDEILKEPNVYRTYEAITHYGLAIKELINEQCGDGIMSAIDFYLDVGTTIGKLGEKRVVITLNGKFLPFIEQASADNGAPSPRAE